jgi:predicted dehydrogenase
MGKEKQATRRQFMGSTGKAAAGLAGVALAAQSRRASANDKVNVGIIGCGWRGGAHMSTLMKLAELQGGVEIVAVSDLYDRRLNEAVERTGAKGYRDYRELLARDDIDAVTAPLPWHWHGKICLDALEAGKDIYVETPMTNKIDEARKVWETSQRTGKLVQVGNQHITDDAYTKAREVVQSGILGKVVIASAGYVRNSSEGQWNYVSPHACTITPDANAETTKWPVWLGLEWGLAPERAFDPQRFFRWRKFRDYGGGAASDLLCHSLGAMMVPMGHEFAYQVTTAGGQYVEMDRDVFDTYVTLAEFPSGYTCVMDNTMVNAYGLPPHIRGHEATVLIDGEGVVIVPERPFLQGFEERCEAKGHKGEWIDWPVYLGSGMRPVKSLRIASAKSELSTTDLHFADFLDCVRTRRQPREGAWEGYQITVAVEMGVLSYFDNRTMYFDTEKQKLRSDIPKRMNQQVF